VVVKLKQLGETVPGEFLSANLHISSRNSPGTIVKVQRAAYSLKYQRAIPNAASSLS